MATNSRPRTRINVTYGTIGTTEAAGALNPVLIAPRYALHSYLGESGYLGAKLGEFKAGTGITATAWPEHQEGAIVDTNSAELYMENMSILMNNTAISGTPTSGGNLITITSKSLKGDYSEITGGYPHAEELDSSMDVEVGDKVVIGGSTYRVTGIQATKSNAAIGTPVALVGSGTAPTASGSFTGTEDATYIVKVLETTTASATAVKFSVTAIMGDSGYSETFAATKGTAVDAGRFGLTIKFTTNTATTNGDAWKVDCTTGAILGYNKVYVDKTFSDTTSISMKFTTARFSDEFTKLNSGYLTTTAAAVGVDANVAVNIGNKAYFVANGIAYVNYRELLTEDALEVVASSSNSLSDWLGVVSPANPLALMYAAATTAGAGFCYLVPTTGSGDSDYIQAINYAAQFEDLYALVPYKQNATIQDAVIAAIEKYADPLIAQFKYAWLHALSEKRAAVYTKTSTGAAITGTIAANGVVTLSTPADVIAGGVAPGDILVVQGDYDEATGTYAELEFTVTDVTSTSTVKVSNPSVQSLSRMSFYRDSTNAEFAKRIAAEAKNLNHYRVSLVWADKVSAQGFDNVPLSVLCAALAGQRSSLPPHAPMTNRAVTGITTSDTLKFTDAQYDILNDGGVWVVAKDTDGATINYHQITTKTDGTIAEENSCVSGGDYILRLMRNAIKVYTNGSGNVSKELINALKGVLTAQANYIMGIPYDDMYGPIMTAFEIVKLEIPDSNKAAVVAQLRCEMPQPMLDGTFTFNLV